MKITFDEKTADKIKAFGDVVKNFRNISFFYGNNTIARNSTSTSVNFSIDFTQSMVKIKNSTAELLSPNLLIVDFRGKQKAS